MIHDHQVRNLIQKYARIEAMEYDGVHSGRTRAMDYTVDGPRMAAMNARDMIKYTLQNVNPLFTHTTALLETIQPIFDDADAKRLASQEPELNLMYYSGALLSLEKSHEELKTMALEAMRKDLEVLAPGYKQKVEDWIATLIDIPAGENVRDGACSFEEGVARDVAVIDQEVVATKKIADALKADYERANAEYLATKERACAASNERNVAELKRKVGELDAVDAFIAKCGRQ